MKIPLPGGCFSGLTRGLHFICGAVTRELSVRMGPATVIPFHADLTQGHMLPMHPGKHENFFNGYCHLDASSVSKTGLREEARDKGSRCCGEGIGENMFLTQQRQPCEHAALWGLALFVFGMVRFLPKYSTPDMHVYFRIYRMHPWRLREYLALAFLRPQTADRHDLQR